MYTKNLTSRRWLIIMGLGLLLLALLALTSYASADVPPVWDRSSIELTGQCLPNNIAEFTLTNTGADMTDSSYWHVFENDALFDTGLFQLLANGTQTWTFGPGGTWRFEAEQRPGHPGNSRPNLTLNCLPTAVTLQQFSAHAWWQFWR